MLLPPGTTLYNGNYVIDALLEDADNGALYWGTQIATGCPVYLQAGAKLSPEPAADGGSNPAQDLLKTSHPCLTGILEAFVDSQNHYVVIAVEAGQPWSHRQRYSGPLPPAQAVKRIQQAATNMLWLMEQGIATPDLSPNRIWWPDQGAALVLTGGLGSPSSEPFNPVAVLATLLWQFLLGRTNNPPAMVAQLQHQQPSASPEILQAIQLGLEATPPPRADLTSTVTAWLQSLPLSDVDIAPMPPQIPVAKSPLASRPLDSAATAHLFPKPSSRRPGLALIMTALIAAIGGLGAGAAWRFTPRPQVPGTARFSPEQGFPTLSNWAGDNPVESSEQTEPRSRDRWQPSQVPSGSSLVRPEGLGQDPDRWASPVDPWEPLPDSAETLNEDALAPRTTAPLRPNELDSPQEGAPEPDASIDEPPETSDKSSPAEPTVAEPTISPVTPNEPGAAPPEGVPPPAPTPEISTAES